MSDKKKFITEIPKEAGCAVSMIEFKGIIILACQYCIYQLSSENVFKKIEFELQQPATTNGG